MTGTAEPGAESGAEGARVLVVSADGAVRQALVLMLEAEGIPACSFASAAEFLGMREGPGAARAAPRCLLVEEKLPGPGGGALAATALAAGRARAAVILAPPARRAAPRPARAGIAFVDPFQLDEVLRAVRQALGNRTPCPAPPPAATAMPQPCRP